mgnify:CR=1 FL=1
MGLIREPLDVDFYLIDKPWNSADTKEFSALIKKLKWREFVNFKGVYGTMSLSNQSLMPLNNPNITTPSFFVGGKPYMELGYGIENIFRFVRLDFIHRLTYLDESHPNAKAFGLKGTAVFRF